MKKVRHYLQLSIDVDKGIEVDEVQRTRREKPQSNY